MSDRENDYLDDLLNNEEDDIDLMIAQTRREIGMLNEEPEKKSMPEFRDQEYRDIFDEDFERAFEDEPVIEAKPTVQEPLPEKPEEVPQKKPTLRERRKLRRAKKRKDSWVLAIFGTAIYFVLIAAAAILIAKFAWLCADDVLALTKKDATATISLDEDDDLDTITEKLYDAGLINYPWLFKMYGELSHVEQKVSHGVFELNTLYDYHALVNGMSGSYKRMTTKVTIIEGKSCREVFEQLEESGVCSVEKLQEASANYEFSYEFLKDIAYGDKYRLEGYLFPDTYEFYLNDDPENVLAKFLDNFEYRIDDEIMDRIASSGYSLHEILTIASMIQEEAAAVKECSTIASVIYNRMKSDSLQRLQLDSTVYYGAALLGEEFSTELDSPYNTYKISGLTPGPIDNPGLDAIQAALYPSSTNYYYFAYGTDGLSHFYQDWDSFAAFLASDDYAG